MSDDFERAWQTLPRRARTRKPRFRMSWSNAARKVGFDAAAVIELFVVYYNSPEGRGEHYRLPSTLLDDEFWDDDPAAWERKETRINPFSGEAR